MSTGCATRPRWSLGTVSAGFAIWHLFLAWSASIATQGNAACFQLVLNENLDGYDRTRWVRQGTAVLEQLS